MVLRVTRGLLSPYPLFSGFLRTFSLGRGISVHVSLFLYDCSLWTEGGNGEDMKKSVLGLVVALLCMSGNVMAQSNEREVLIDKIVNQSLNQMSRVKMIQLAKEYTDELDPIEAEAAIYAISQQLARPIVAKSYSNLTEEQLKEVLRFMRSDAYHRISSDGVAESLGLYLFVDMMGYMVYTEYARILGVQPSSTSWKPFVSPLNDKEYSSLVDDYIELTGALSVFDKVMPQIKEKLKQEMDVNTAGMMTSMIKRMQKYYPVYYKAALIEYVSKEQLQEVVDFYSRPYMIEVSKAAKGTMMSLPDEVMKDSEALEKMMLRYFENNADMSSVVHAYIARLPYMPVCNRVNEIFPVRTLAMKKKATYTGQTRDGLAHGKGVLTDKKGVRYSGDFKEGKRHGLITTYLLSGDSVSQVWANDKLLKEQNTDLAKHASHYKDEVMGYGYNTTEDGREEGFFIDGSLEGYGKRTKNGVKEEGWFDDGGLTKGRIIDNSAHDKNVQFEGELLKGLVSEIRKGTTRIDAKTNGKKTTRIKTGTLVDGVMHGIGSWEYEENGYTQHDEGCFAYDKLYGKGSRTRKWNKESRVENYDGEFFAGKYQGQGVETATWTTDNGTNYKRTVSGHFNQGKPEGEICFKEEVGNIPLFSDGRGWLFTYYGIQYAIFTDSFSITINGTVANDKLIGEAEITLSNGDYYKGIFKNGEFKEGVVRKTNSDRSVYEGDMKNGKYEGQGKLTYSNGNSDEGTFMYGTCIDGVHKDKRGKVLWKIR